MVSRPPSWTYVLTVIRRVPRVCFFYFFFIYSFHFFISLSFPKFRERRSGTIGSTSRKRTRVCLMDIPPSPTISTQTRGHFGLTRQVYIVCVNLGVVYRQYICRADLGAGPVLMLVCILAGFYTTAEGLGLSNFLTKDELNQQRWWWWWWWWGFM
jgi:hypothetical protein